jgi:hypothetical protein
MKIKIDNTLLKKARKGFKGYPVATVAYYGPDSQSATKVAVGLIEHEGAEPVMKKWFSPGVDARLNHSLTREIEKYLIAAGVVSVGALPKILGCPHEEGVDYPDGATCPSCPYWADKDRWKND